MISINFLAVFLAALAAFILGFLFHGPISGKLWMKLANIHPTGNEKFADMIPQLIWNFVVNLVTAGGLAALYSITSTSPLLYGASVATGITTAILVWFGFMVTSSSIEVIWMGRSAKLWLFEAVCSLIVMAVMGAIIASV